MRFVITRASNTKFEEPCPCEGAESNGKDGDDREWTIELATLEDMQALGERVKQSLVVGFGRVPRITIYDTWLE